MRRRPYTFKKVRLPITETVPQRMRSRIPALSDEIVHSIRSSSPAAGKDGLEHFTFATFWNEVISLACAFKAIGIKRGQHVGIISDNRREWMKIDLALLSLGAIDVPRGSDTTVDEISYILAHAECGTVFAENARIADLILSRKGVLKGLSRLVLIDDERGKIEAVSSGIEILTLSELLGKGKAASPAERSAIDREIDAGKPDDVATMIYTSGTTGEPKGVILPHKSFIFQIENIYNYIHVHPWDVCISVLPVWHSYERAVEYVLYERGLSVVYSKPVGSILIQDMAVFRPTILPTVPRLMEAVMQGVYRNVNQKGGISKVLFNFFIRAGGSYAYCRNLMRGWLPAFQPRIRFLDAVLGALGAFFLYGWKLLGYLLVFKKIHAKFGGRFCMAVVGGGALPKNVDDFYQAIGITCLEGYGLTETGPILAVREQHRPVVGTIGPIFKDVQWEVRSIEDGKTVLGPGQKGILYVKSLQNMYGYYKKDDETAKVLNDGWLNTGDITMFTHGKSPCIKILGRIKDTIVLRGGKNIEPDPMEQKLNAHPEILQSMIVGQDQKFLGALLVPAQENLEAWAASAGIKAASYADLLMDPKVVQHVEDVVHDIISVKNGFHTYERVFKVALLEKPFEVGEFMTQTLKIKRHVVSQAFAERIASLFD
jgi:long-chain acyl-CoA synthetase